MSNITKKQALIYLIPNDISVLRVFLSVGLFAVGYGTIGFYILFALAVFSDILDGFLARKLRCATLMGSQLDTAADFVLVFSTFYVINEAGYFSLYIYISIGVIAFIKLLAYAVAKYKNKRAIMPHHIVNKIAGFVLVVSAFVLSYNAFIPSVISIEICFISGLFDLVYSLNNKVCISA